MTKSTTNSNKAKLGFVMTAIINSKISTAAPTVIRRMPNVAVKTR